MFPEMSWATFTMTCCVQKFCTTTCHLYSSTVAIKLRPDRPIHIACPCSVNDALEPAAACSSSMSAGELPIETFLKAQPRSTLIRLYEKPASCLAVFRYVRFR